MIVQTLSVELMSLIIQLLTLLLVVVYSVSALDTEKAMKFGCGAMFLANLFGQLIIAGGGPGACFGFIGLPFLGAGVAYVTVIFSEAVQDATKWAKHKRSE